MQLDIPYKSLKHTLLMIKRQVFDSLPYVASYVPSDIDNPEDLFYFLRDLVTYKKDPKGIELLQSITMLLNADKNWHGKAGYGDCDCFTILSLASCIHLGFTPVQVALAGNSKISPSHIYSMVYDADKKRMCAFDLTNPYYDMERNYKYKQTLNFTMRLVLGDSGLSSKATRKAKKQIKSTKKIAKKQAKANTQIAKAQGKSNRKISRQDRRTDRVDQQGQRKGAKRMLKVAKKDKKLIRVKGKQDVINARNEAKIQQIQNQQATDTYDNSYNPGSDQIPNTGIYPGGEWQASSGSGEDYYDDYDLLPEEEVDELEYVEEEGLSGWIDDLVQGVKKTAKTIKAGKAAQAFNKAAGTVQKGTSKYNELMQLKQENAMLKSQVDEGKRTCIMTSAGTGVAGLVIGYALSKAFK